MEKDIIRDITSGMFIASTINSACIVDTVLQVSSTPKPLLSVCINKNNYTNEMLKLNKKFAIAILSTKVKGDIIKTFGFNSSRDIDKFANYEYLEIEGVKIIKDAIGYLYCQVVDVIDTKTHDIFLGEVIKSERFSNEKPLSYLDYQDKKEEYLKITTPSGKTAYVCTVCGYVYYGDDLPADFICPKCGVDSRAFEKRNIKEN